MRVCTERHQVFAIMKKLWLLDAVFSIRDQIALYIVLVSQVHKRRRRLAKQAQGRHVGIAHSYCR